MTHLALLANGRSYHVQKWAAALRAEGLEISLVTFHPPDTEIEGVRIHRLTPRIGNLVRRMSWADFWPAKELVRLLGEHGVDVLLASSATNYGWMARRSGFHPTILQTWTYDVSVHPLQGWRRGIFRRVVQKSIAHADTILTDGEALATVVRDRFDVGATPVISVLWGIDLEANLVDEAAGADLRQQLGIPPDAPVVTSPRGALSWYRPEPVLASLIRLLDLQDKVHAIFLTLAHERGPDIARLLQELQCHPRGHVFDRFLSREEMRALWSASDVAISIPPHDGISVALLEAMWAGVIPVVSDIGSNRAILNDNRAVFLGEFSPSALTTVLLSVLTDQMSHKPRIAESNRSWIRQHASVDNAARTIASIAKELSKRGKMKDSA